MEKTKKRIFKLQERVDNLFLLAWLSLIVSACAMIAFFTHHHAEDADTLNIIKVDGIERAPYGVRNYVCTAGIEIQDYREGCKPYRCELWFKGKGECAYE